MRVPWIARKSKQSILKEINPEYSLEGLILKLKLYYFGYLMQRADALKKTLILEKIEGKVRWKQQRMRWLDCITDSMDMNLSKLSDSGGQRSLACCSPWDHKEADMTERFSLTFIQGITSFSSVAQSCTTLCDPMDCSTPGFPVPPEAFSNSCPLSR